MIFRILRWAHSAPWCPASVCSGRSQKNPKSPFKERRRSGLWRAQTSTSHPESHAASPTYSSALSDLGSQRGVLLPDGLVVVQNPLQVGNCFVPVFRLNLWEAKEHHESSQIHPWRQTSSVVSCHARISHRKTNSRNWFFFIWLVLQLIWWKRLLTRTGLCLDHSDVTCSSRSRTSRRMVPVSSMVWISWLQFCRDENRQRSHDNQSKVLLVSTYLVQGRQVLIGFTDRLVFFGVLRTTNGGLRRKPDLRGSVLIKLLKESPTLKTISSVTANVRSSFPLRLLISFCSCFVSDKIWKIKR